MAEEAQALEVTSSGQPQVVAIEPASASEVASTVTVHPAANVTVTITPAQG